MASAPPPPDRDAALAALEAGDLAAALEAFRARAAALTDDPDAATDLGLALLHAGGPGHAAEAVAALRAAVARAPAHLAARRALARALDAADLPDEALAELRAVERASPDAAAARALGALCYRRRLHDEAAAAFERALARAPDDARAAYGLGLAREARRDLGGAIAAYRDAVRLDPGFVPPHRTLADALAMVGEHEAAIAALDALLAVHRTDEQAALNREVLARALRELRARRLLGRAAEDVAGSALVRPGPHRHAGPLRAPPGHRYAARRSEVYVFLAAGGAVRGALLYLPDPARAARAADEYFGVTVVDERGGARAADYGTAVTLTFLRELLGVTLTQAGALYRRLLAGEAEVRAGGAFARFAARVVDDRELSGLEVGLVAP